MLTAEQIAQLPKARLFWIHRLSLPRNWHDRRRPFFAKFRNANAMFIWIGGLEIGWRMPWIEHSASITLAAMAVGAGKGSKIDTSLQRTAPAPVAPPVDPLDGQANPAAPDPAGSVPANNSGTRLRGWVATCQNMSISPLGESM